MNLLLMLLAHRPRTASVEWRIDLAARAVLAKAILQVPAASDISAHLNALRESISGGHYFARNIRREIIPWTKERGEIG